MPEKPNELRYVSTRGAAPELGFEDVMLTGLASDGGLYVPREWPRLDAGQISGFAGQDYADVAAAVMQPFVGADIDQDEFAALVAEAYASFSHKAITPLVQISPNEWLLELFHGPTIAFKDVAMQLLARLMDRALSRRQRRATIVGATSGDTGGAAIEAFAGRDAIDIFILFPDGRVSDVQRRQMTCCTADNVHNIAIEGTFDDCQALVKAMFNDAQRRERLSLAGVNSINWARIMAQSVYYFVASVALGGPDRKLSFSVPTGNFGDIFAGYVAHQMGLPIERLVIATNTNDILARTLKNGAYEPRTVVATTSPSMDIQISSNFERLMFEAADRNASQVQAHMTALNDQGGFKLSDNERNAMASLFSAATASEEDVNAAMRELADETGYICDPHTAVGIAAGRSYSDAGTHVVTLATAHPAKFPDAVKAATRVEPALPSRVAEKLQAEEQFTVLPNNYDDVAVYIEERTRALGETAS